MHSTVPLSDTSDNNGEEYQKWLESTGFCSIDSTSTAVEDSRINRFKQYNQQFAVAAVS